MVYCNHCCKDVVSELVDESYLACGSCGKVLIDHIFSDEPTFVKNSSGQAKLSGNYVKAVQSAFSESRQRTLRKASTEMEHLSLSLGVEDGETIRQASVFYELALEKSFTRGRKSEQVQAACLYIAFRQNKKPYFLIDFSNNLRINVYVLGAVFLQLCEVLRLMNHPIVKKPIDPCLYLYKYTSNLLGHRNVAVSETALNIIASMNRDWMQTGRKPGGLFGAALYIAALGHGFTLSKKDILRLVNVCEATLTKRLAEFENTDSSSLTVDELNIMVKEHERNPAVLPSSKFQGSTSKDLVCEHRDCEYEVPYFALGLCEECYKEFHKLSGGLGGGLDPPAFQRAERERVKKTLSKESAHVEKASNSKYNGKIEDLPTSVLERDDTSVESQDESGNFSDLNDQEVDGYLLSEEEKPYKKKIWEDNNHEYLEEQAAKEEAAAAEKKIYEENLKNCPVESRELYESSTAAVAKSRKRKAQQAKSSGPAQSAADAACRMVEEKGHSNKFNMERLPMLFQDETSPKKVQLELPSKNHELGSGDYIEDGNEDWYNNEDMGEVYFPEEVGYSYAEKYY